jgi:hypothetical protein
MLFKNNSFFLSLLTLFTLLSISIAHADSSASDQEKNIFEKEFTEQCIAREIKNSINKDIDRKRFEKPCNCIAGQIIKNLTAVDAENFLVEKKNTQSMRINFDKAAYFCLQNKPLPKAPNLFRKK